MKNFYKSLIFVILIFYVLDSRAHILGSQNQLNSVVLQSDGKAVAAGLTVVNNMQSLLVVRYTTTGLLDTTFGNNGVLVIPAGDNPVAYGVMLDASGKIVIVGSTVINAVAYVVVARITTAGALDTTFGMNGVVLSSFEGGCSGYAMVIQSDGKIVVTGAVVKDNDVYMPLIRYNTNGTLDTTFGTNGISIIDDEDCAIAYSLLMQPDGKFVLGGFAEGQGLIARCLSSGVIDTSFGTGGLTSLQVGVSSFIKGIALQSSGSIIVGGFSNGQCLVARLTTNGSIDTSFGVNGVTLNNFALYNVGLDVGIDSNDRILLAGLSDTSAILVRYSSSGVLDTTFGTQGVASVHCGVGNVNALAFQSDDKIIIAGFSDNNAMVARITTAGLFDTLYGTNGLVLDPTDYFPTCNLSNVSKGYVFAYDTTTQTVSIANTYQDITLNINGQLNGWSHSTGTPIFTCVRSGLYQVIYTIVSEKTSGSGVISASIRATLNSSEIPGSQLAYDFSTNFQTMSPSKSFMSSFNAGDVLKFQYTGGSTACRLIAGDGVGTTRASISVTIVQVV
jgi:uncharacterized delta-60 repeat protein